MTTEVLAEYTDEGFAILRDGGGIYVFDRTDSILPINDDENYELPLRTKPGAWPHPAKKLQQEQRAY